MATTMHTAVVSGFGQPLAFPAWPMPQPGPGPGPILVKTEAVGVCHPDRHDANGDWPLKPSLSFIPGYEGTGRVAAVGMGVTRVDDGDRVGLPWLDVACGHFEDCLQARETVYGAGRQFSVGTL